MRSIQIKLQSTDELSLIKQYLYLTRAVNGLTDRELEFTAVIIRNAKKENGDLRKVLDHEGRAQLKRELGATPNALNVMISRLKSKGIIKGMKLDGVAKILTFDNDGCELLVTLQLNAKKD